MKLGTPFSDTAVRVELFVKEDDVWFSEVPPRPHDTGLVTLATQTQTRFARMRGRFPACRSTSTSATSGPARSSMAAWMR